jgi:hypothetical protein
MYSSPSEFKEAAQRWLHQLGEQYLRDVWLDQHHFVEVWVEKDALTQVIASVIQAPLRVTTAPSRGYSSYTYLKREAVEGRFANIDKPITILDFRDHDPSGINMTDDLETRLKNKYGVEKDITIRRVALNMEQIDHYGLKELGQEVKPKDSRSKDYIARFGDKGWELDTIEPSELQRIVPEV